MLMGMCRLTPERPPPTLADLGDGLDVNELIQLGDAKLSDPRAVTTYTSLLFRRLVGLLNAHVALTGRPTYIKGFQISLRDGAIHHTGGLTTDPAEAGVIDFPNGHCYTVAELVAARPIPEPANA